MTRLEVASQLFGHFFVVNFAAYMWVYTILLFLPCHTQEWRCRYLCKLHKASWLPVCEMVKPTVRHVAQTAPEEDHHRVMITSWLEETGWTSMNHLIGRTFSPWTSEYTLPGRPFNAHCCNMGTAIKYPVPDRVKLSFVIFDIRALWRSGLSVRVPGCQKLQMTA